MGGSFFHHPLPRTIKQAFEWEEPDHKLLVKKVRQSLRDRKIPTAPPKQITSQKTQSAIRPEVNITKNSNNQYHKGNQIAQCVQSNNLFPQNLSLQSVQHDIGTRTVSMDSERKATHNDSTIMLQNVLEWLKNQSVHTSTTSTKQSEPLVNDEYVPLNSQYSVSSLDEDFTPLPF